MNTASTTSQSGLAAPTSADDPVCGMNVLADKAAARLELDGKLYLFCSTAFGVLTYQVSIKTIELPSLGNTTE